MLKTTVLQELGAGPVRSIAKLYPCQTIRLLSRGSRQTIQTAIGTESSELAERVIVKLAERGYLESQGTFRRKPRNEDKLLRMA